MESFEFSPTDLDGVVRIRARRHADARGWLGESYRRSAFAEAGIDRPFVQDNLSLSSAGTLRGMHYQIAPHAQGKLLRVLSGRLFDVVVDIRRSSPTYGRWLGQTLSAVGDEMLWVAPGFAHGFLALEDDTHLLYKCTAEYHPASERAIHWNDPDLGIQWPEVGHPYLVSEKDDQAAAYRDAETFE